MPALLVAPDAMTTAPDLVESETVAPHERGARSRCRPLAVVVGLFVLSTVLLLALAVVALTDGQGETDGEDEL